MPFAASLSRSFGGAESCSTAAILCRAPNQIDAVSIDFDRFGVRRRAALQVCMKFGFVLRIMRVSECQSEQELKGLLLPTINQLVVWLIEIGKQASVTAGDTARIRVTDKCRRPPDGRILKAGGIVVHYLQRLSGDGPKSRLLLSQS